MLVGCQHQVFLHNQSTSICWTVLICADASSRSGPGQAPAPCPWPRCDSSHWLVNQSSLSPKLPPRNDRKVPPQKCHLGYIHSFSQFQLKIYALQISPDVYRRIKKSTVSQFLPRSLRNNNETQRINEVYHLLALPRLLYRIRPWGEDEEEGCGARGVLPLKSGFTEKESQKE